MSTTANSSPDEQLLTLTQEMLAFAEASDWESLSDLEKTRLPLIQKVFAKVDSSNKDFAEKILSIDEKTKSLAEAGKPVLQQEILMIKNSGKVNNAYQSIQALKPGNDSQ